MVYEIVAMCTAQYLLKSSYTPILKTSRTPKAYIPLPCLDPSKLLSDAHHTHHLPGQSTRGRSQGLCKANIKANIIASKGSIIKDAQLGVTLRNANDALLHIRRNRKSFPRSSLFHMHTAVTCCSATAAATTYRIRHRVESHKR